MLIETKQKAFTLIEMLVVIFIIAILASVILVITLQSRSKARDAQRIANAFQVSGALENYYDVTGSYPSVNCISSPWWNCWGSAGEPSLLPTAYITKMPQDPSFSDNGHMCQRPSDPPSHAYSYYSDNGQRYIVAVNLENAPATGDSHIYTGNYGCTGYANWAIVKGF